jgi:hypothetical protein
VPEQYVQQWGRSVGQHYGGDSGSFELDFNDVGSIGCFEQLGGRRDQQHAKQQ